MDSNPKEFTTTRIAKKTRKELNKIIHPELEDNLSANDRIELLIKEIKELREAKR